MFNSCIHGCETVTTGLDFMGSTNCVTVEITFYATSCHNGFFFYAIASLAPSAVSPFKMFTVLGTSSWCLSQARTIHQRQPCNNPPPRTSGPGSPFWLQSPQTRAA